MRREQVTPVPIFWEGFGPASEKCRTGCLMFSMFVARGRSNARLNELSYACGSSVCLFVILLGNYFICLHVVQPVVQMHQVVIRLDIFNHEMFWSFGTHAFS